MWEEKRNGWSQRSEKHKSEEKGKERRRKEEKIMRSTMTRESKTGQLKGCSSRVAWSQTKTGQPLVKYSSVWSRGGGLKEGGESKGREERSERNRRQRIQNMSVRAH